MNSKILLFIAVAFFASKVEGHLMPNFLFHLTDSAGNRPYPPIYADRLTKFYFNFVDMYNNFKQVKATELLLFHDRYIHLLIASEDNELVMHAHPDDFGNILIMDQTSGCFYINLVFPRYGYWMVTASFLFTNGSFIREGVSATSFYVYPNNGSQAMSTTTWNYTPENNFRIYPLEPNNVYNHFVNSNTNVEDNGVYVSMEFGNPEISHGGHQMKRRQVTLQRLENITTAECVPFTLHVRVLENGNYIPATLVPYLAAPVHFTMVSDQNFVYHAHGSYLLPNMTIDDARMLVMNEYGSMHGNMSGGDNMDTMSVVHHGIMMGLTGNGTINCFVEAGQVIRDTGMSMGTLEGPDTFGPDIIGIFDFPLTGNFRVWANMKIRLANGTEFLFTPHFDVKVVPPQAPGLTTDMDHSMTDGMTGGMTAGATAGMTGGMTGMDMSTSGHGDHHTTEAVNSGMTLYGFSLLGFAALCVFLCAQVQ